MAATSIAYTFTWKVEVCSPNYGMVFGLKDSVDSCNFGVVVGYFNIKEQLQDVFLEREGFLYSIY